MIRPQAFSSRKKASTVDTGEGIGELNCDLKNNGFS